jgi:uncharacterized membrane protein
VEPIDATATVQGASAASAVSPVVSEKDLANSKDLAAISYVWILSAVVYATRRDSPFVRFHAKQGMALFSLSILAWFIPYLGKPLELCLLALAVMGFAAAAQGHWKDLPLIGPLSRGEWKLVGSSIKGLMVDIRYGISTLKGMVKKHPAAMTAMPVPTPAQPVSSVTPPSMPAPGQGSVSTLPSEL